MATRISSALAARSEATSATAAKEIATKTQALPLFAASFHLGAGTARSVKAPNHHLLWLEILNLYCSIGPPSRHNFTDSNDGPSVKQKPYPQARVKALLDDLSIRVLYRLQPEHFAKLLQ